MAVISVSDKMESMNKYELNNQAGVALMEEPPAQDEQSDIVSEMDNIPYADLISAVENRILSKERNKSNTNISYLTNYLDMIRDKKESFLKNIRSEKRKLLAKSFFEIEEMIVRGLIEDRVGSRSKEFRIEDSEWQQEIISLINKIKNNPEELRMFWDEFDALFDYEENEDDEKSANKYRAGIMAPLALQNILEEKYGLKVAYSKPTEDVECLVDMTAFDELGKKFFLIQVKTDKELIEKIIKKDLRGESRGGNNEKELIKIIPRFEFGNNNGEMHKDYKNFSEGCSRYVENNRDFFQGKGKGYEVKGVYIYVPYIIRGKKLIGMDGTPDYKLWEILVAEHLETKLDLPNKFDYGSILRK